LSGIVLDLRNNPGGLLDQSVILADDFLDHGEIVSIRGRDQREQRSFDSMPGDLAEGLPVVVLVNAGSASASEIVASALQDHGRAIVLGTRSFGKGSVQTIAPLSNNGALRLTTSLYYSPSGRAIQATGVMPDIVIPIDDNPDLKREADLPHALPKVATRPRDERITLDKDVCPAVGENDDRQLGCALSLLRAGSKEKFLAEVGAASRM
jgi:carboxyl-terminal processing protease